MKEQSHKEEMSAALRGDFQRLRARGVSPALVPQDTPEAKDSPNGGESSPDARVESVTEPPSEPPIELRSAPAAEPPSAPPAELPTAPPAELPDDTSPPRRSWLSRLSGR